MSDERDLTGLTCEVDVPNGGRSPGFHRCRRPAKGFGPARFNSASEIPQCGVHLAAERRRAAEAAKRADRDRGDAERHAAAVLLIGALPEWLRSNAGPDWSPLSSAFTGKVRLTLDADTLERLNSALARATRLGEPQ